TYKDYYGGNNTNIVYYIRRTVGKNTEVYSNTSVSTTNLESLEKQLKEECGKYIVYDPGNMKYETNTMIEETTVRYILQGFEYAYPEDTQILIGVKIPYQVSDAFTVARSGYNQYSPHFWQYIAMSVIGIILYLFLLVILTIREGKDTKIPTGEKTIRLKYEDKIPTEIMLLLTAAVVAAVISGWLVFVRVIGIKEMIDTDAAPVLAGALALIISLLFSFFYYSYVRRIKAKTIWKNSILRRLCDKAVKMGIYLYDNSSAVLRVLVPALGLFFLNMLLWIVLASGTRNISSGLFPLILILALFADGVAIICFYKSSIDRQHILDGIKQINAGDTEHKIEETSLHGDNLVLAREINGIGEGIRNAVATSMKDERLKADLITNVSHDIKTPLTSIINYVDLIKRENIDNPKVKEYIDVLDAKSQRLKQLTDDLVEASKISSGNIVLQMEKINLIELLNQTIGEFSEKFEQKNLIPVIRTKKSILYIEADSRRIWRVIENLFNNIFKYALPGTRVYIDVEEMKTEKGIRQVALSIKNISANPIKVNSDELTERFIRGDESRTTEGSGLGLSIAKNLTEVMKGKFEIIVDGDLFKVVLTFPLLEQN
ncbi:MAG: sensor histidine kinase, partial [Suilimivivens sp.]